MKTEITKITPAKAAEYLMLNKHNRRINNTIVQRLAKQMRNGTFKLTHQGIAINRTTNTLVDGQHRLLAIIEAGVTVTMNVSYLDEDVFDVIDIGKHRSAYDTLSMAGITYAATMSPAIRLVQWFESLPENKPLNIVGIKQPIPNNELLQYVQDHPELEKIAPQADHVTREMGRMGVRSPLTAGAFVIATKTENSEATFAEFMARLGDGMYLVEGHPIATLRRWVIVRYNNADRALRSQFTMIHMIRAWSAFAQGRELARLQFRNGKDHKPRILSAGEKTENGPHDESQAG